MSSTIALVLAPSQTLFSDPNQLQYSPPPLTLAVLQGHLRARGFTVHSTDLNVHLADLMAQGGEWWEPLFDKDLMLGFLRGSEPGGLDMALRPLVAAVRIDGADLIGVSTGTSMSLFEIHVALMVARALQARAVRDYLAATGAGRDPDDVRAELLAEFGEGLTTRVVAEFGAPERALDAVSWPTCFGCDACPVASSCRYVPLLQRVKRVHDRYQQNLPDQQALAQLWL